jgi:hypothetical protein
VIEEGIEGDTEDSVFFVGNGGGRRTAGDGRCGSSSRCGGHSAEGMMEQRFVIKGPLALVVLALSVGGVYFDLHDYAEADLRSAYAGKVVDEGTDYHILGRPRWHRYIVIQDSTGKREKKYVDENGYLSVKVGTFVVKQAGLGQIPREPGSPLP